MISGASASTAQCIMCSPLLVTRASTQSLTVLKNLVRRASHLVVTTLVTHAAASMYLV